jgi:hypothetical protein
MKLAFNGHAYKLAGSSLKSLIGHPQGACGAAGIAATLLAMRDNVVPPTLNVDEPDPECDLDYVRVSARAMDVDTRSPASRSAVRTRLSCCGKSHNAAVLEATSGRGCVAGCSDPLLSAGAIVAIYAAAAARCVRYRML